MRKYLGILLVITFAVLLSDWMVAFLQAGSLIDRVGSENFLAALDEEIVPGMQKPEAEEILRGYRSVDVRREEDELVVRYGYWFGFIPPVGVLQLKFAGEVVVVYSRKNAVLTSHFWIN